MTFDWQSFGFGMAAIVLLQMALSWIQRRRAQRAFDRFVASVKEQPGSRCPLKETIAAQCILTEGHKEKCIFGVGLPEDPPETP